MKAELLRTLNLKLELRKEELSKWAEPDNPMNGTCGYKILENSIEEIEDFIQLIETL